MEDINCWQSKFTICQYSQKLLNKLNLLNSVSYYPVDIDEIIKALYYARKYHGTQIRKSGEPYYSHPIEVADMVSDYIFRTDIIVTSILHDTIEDTKLTKEMISYAFGGIVASQVDDLTRIKIDKKISAAQTLHTLFAENKEYILYIKLFDRLHNMRTIGSLPVSKIIKILDETLTHFIPFAQSLKMHNVAKELLQLCLQATLITQTKEETELILYPH